jgi:hypothetical protein
MAAVRLRNLANKERRLSAAQAWMDRPPVARVSSRRLFVLAPWPPAAVGQTETNEYRFSWSCTSSGALASALRDWGRSCTPMRSLVFRTQISRPASVTGRSTRHGCVATACNGRRSLDPHGPVAAMRVNRRMLSRTKVHPTRALQPLRFRGSLAVQFCRDRSFPCCLSCMLA